MAWQRSGGRRGWQEEEEKNSWDRAHYPRWHRWHSYPALLRAPQFTSSGSFRIDINACACCRTFSFRAARAFHTFYFPGSMNRCDVVRGLVILVMIPILVSAYPYFYTAHIVYLCPSVKEEDHTHCTFFLAALPLARLGLHVTPAPSSGLPHTTPTHPHPQLPFTWQCSAA